MFFMFRYIELVSHPQIIHISVGLLQLLHHHWDGQLHGSTLDESLQPTTVGEMGV